MDYESFSKEQKSELNKKFIEYYKQAIKIQKDRDINCEIDSESNSLAKNNGFPQKKDY